MGPSLRSLAVIVLMGLSLAGGSLAAAQTPQGARETTAEAQSRLGRRLFGENRFTNPGSNFLVTCGACHKPPEAGGNQAYADQLRRSLLPSRQGSQGRALTTRNTPSLLDVGQMPRLGHDGAFESLESLVEAKLTGPHYGWLEGESERAVDEIYTILINDAGEDGGAEASYAEEFRSALGLTLGELSHREALRGAARALAAYLRTLKTDLSAPWDAFASMNRIPTGPGAGETPEAYAGRVFGRLANLEGRLQVKLVDGFDVDAYEGLKIFFRTSGESSVGNCVACHTPPIFTDFGFHNTGIAQIEYEGVHGPGSFARLEIPALESARRPEPRLSAPPEPGAPGQADLGHWNHAPAAEEAELKAAIGAFKTPSLRNVALTAPYMHNGAYAALEEAVGEIVDVSERARAGVLRAIDPAYLGMNLTEADVAPLVAFLRSLTEVGRSQFRNLLLSARDHTGELSPARP